jgi:hypothetical protein
MFINDLYNNKKFVAEAELNPGEDKYYYRVRHQTKRDIELEMPPKAWDSVGPEYATYEEAQAAFKALQAKYPNEKFTYTQHPRISNMGGTPHRVFPPGVTESIADDMAAIAQKKFPNAYISKNGQEVQKPENWGKPYTPPAAAPADLEKQQRDLTAKYPNIDELVRRAELNRDPNYEYADGQAYYAGREAEQNYLKLKQIQRVIQGLNESLNRSHLP